MKKVLAWAVVLALVLSSFTMAFAGEGGKSSKDFKDYSEIQYTEAVDVMVATGIINGYPDGTFGPAKTVKRAEMAKMIAVMMSGGEDIGDQYKSACPFADSKSHWAAGYIAFCAAEHIIDGRSADVFDPEAQVTGTEVAKMALTSLGYDSKIQGYTGDTWAAAVLKDAKNVGLFEGLDKSFVPGDPCNRESAAQILFNALQAREVYYPTNISVSTEDTDVTVTTQVQPRPYTLYEDVFDGALERDPKSAEEFEQVDGFGNPGHTWAYEDEEVGQYLDTPDYEFIAQAKGFGPALEAYDKALAKAYSKQTPSLIVEAIAVNGEVNYPQAMLGMIGTGDKVKMYKLETYNGKDYYYVVVEQYVAFQITDVNTDIDEDAADEGVTAEVKLATYYAEPQATQATKIEFTVKDIDLPGFDAATYEKDAVVAIAFNYDEMTPLQANGATDFEDAIIDSYVMEELASGTITKMKGDAVTIDGTAYEKATAYAAVDNVPLAAKQDFTLYDYNEFALASTLVPGEDPAEPEVFYGILTKKGQTSADEFGEGVSPLAMIFTAEGQDTKFTVNLDQEKSVIKSLDNVAVETLIAYTVNEDGEINTIEQADPASGWTGEAVATGDVLYGRELDENIVAFAKVQDTTTDPATEKWVVYDLAALKEAKAVDIDFYCDKEAKLTAIICKSLEPAPVKDEVIGFLTKAEPFTNGENEPANDLTVFVNGEEKSFETKGNVAIPADAMYALVVLTKDGELVSAIELADCVGVAKASEDIPTGADAAFYGEGTTAAAFIFEVIGVSGNSLNVGIAAQGETPAYNLYQACTGAKVYCVTFKQDGSVDKVEISSLDKIEKGDGVVLMKLSNDSKVWDTVIFTKAYDGPTKNEWAVNPQETPEP